MSKLSEQLRIINVFNMHDLLRHFGEGGDDVGCIYINPDSRSVHPWQTIVRSPSHQTDPDARNGGHKSFVGSLAESMPKALAWASARYGIDEWAADPTCRGSKIPATVLRRAKAAVKSIRIAELSATAPESQDKVFPLRRPNDP